MRGWALRIALVLAMPALAWGAPKPGPKVLTLLAPGGRTPDTTPAYSWAEAPGAVEYFLWVDGSSGHVFSQWYSASDVCAGGVCSVEPGVILGEDAYQWWIQASGPETGTQWSLKGKFRVGPRRLPPSAAKLVSPAGSVSTPSPVYTWAVIRSATDYHLWVSDPSGVVFDQWYAANEICNESACTVEPPLSLAEGQYAWWVQAQNSVGVGSWSDEKIFVLQSEADEPQSRN